MLEKSFHCSRAQLYKPIPGLPAANPPPPASWHVVTCEYPPQSGGVSDYTYLVAEALAAHGDQVHIWCPAAKEQAPQVPGVDVRQTLGKFSISDLRSLGRNLDAFPSPRHILVQWVPHGFGYKSVNVPFCAVAMESGVRRRDAVDLMVHEPFLPFAPGRWRQNAAATRASHHDAHFAPFGRARVAVHACLGTADPALRLESRAQIRVASAAEYRTRRERSGGQLAAEGPL